MSRTQPQGVGFRLEPLVLGMFNSPRGRRDTKDNCEGCYEEVETVGLDGKGMFLAGLGAIPFLNNIFLVLKTYIYTDYFDCIRLLLPPSSSP